MKTGFASSAAGFSFIRARLKSKFPSTISITDHRWIARGLACLGSLMLLGSLSAQPLSIALSSAQYTTYVEAQGTPTSIYPPISRTTVSAFPISDEISRPLTEGFGAGGTNYARATAGLFGVSDWTGWGAANASATSQLWFSPSADQTQTIGIQIYAVGATQAQRFTGGQVSLFDQTAGSELWNYSWSVFVGPNAGSGNVPWDPVNNSTANFNLDTDFLASHQYELTMQTYSNAGDDTEIVQIQLTGLEAVPEPFGVSLVLLALLGLPAVRRSAGN